MIKYTKSDIQAYEIKLNVSNKIENVFVNVSTKEEVVLGRVQSGKLADLLLVTGLYGRTIQHSFETHLRLGARHPHRRWNRRHAICQHSSEHLVQICQISQTMLQVQPRVVRRYRGEVAEASRLHLGQQGLPVVRVVHRAPQSARVTATQALQTLHRRPLVHDLGQGGARDKRLRFLAKRQRRRLRSFVDQFLTLK